MWTWAQSRAAFAGLVRYGAPYWRILGGGFLATLGVVFCRLALPWPLRGVMEAVFPPSDPSPSTVLAWLPDYGDPIVWLALAYFVLAVVAGLSEMAQRVSMKQFAVVTVHDMRAHAVHNVLTGQGPAERGDVLARIIGDTARIKEGLSGILVHVSQNGLLFVGVVVVFLFLHMPLGLVFLAGGLVAIWVGFRTVPPVAAESGEHRRNEGAYASWLNGALERGGVAESETLDAASASQEVRTTKLITRSSVVVHGILALTVGSGLWIGALAARNGLLEPGVLFLFVAYALTVHRRVVQVGRQVARLGKVFASMERLAALLGSEDAAHPQQALLDSLHAGLCLEDAAPVRANGRAELAPITLQIQAGARVVVLGRAGSGKSTLLGLLAGREFASTGRLRWDDVVLSGAAIHRLLAVGYLPQNPTFPRTRVWRLLGLSGPRALREADRDSLSRLGAWQTIRSLPRRLRAKIASSDLSVYEARALRLARVVFSPAPVWILDAPIDGLDKKGASKCLHEIVDRAQGRTLVVSQGRPTKLHLFDRILEMRSGQVVFDGPPEHWLKQQDTSHGAVS